MNGSPGLARARRLVGQAFVLAAVLLAIAWFMKRRAIPATAIDAASMRAPVQSATSRPQFTFDFDGRAVRVRPVAEYRIGGLVLSRNDVESFADIYHDASSVDTVDLCLLSGESLSTDDFHQVKVSSGPFTCYFRYPPGIHFHPDDLSNNHLITADPAIRTRLEAIDTGDQVLLRGLLVDYQMEDWHDWWRRTSTVRGDDGCEVVLVESLEVLRRGAPRWRRLYQVSGCLVVILPALWVALFWLGFPAHPPASPPRRPGPR